jgi:hypothetical protein
MRATCTRFANKFPEDINKSIKSNKPWFFSKFVTLEKKQRFSVVDTTKTQDGFTKDS